MPVTIDGSLGITTPMYNGAIAANVVTPVTSFKNRIINGDCRIDQRNEGASVTIAFNGTVTIDRFISFVSQGSRISVQRNAGSVTPPAGFTNYIGCTSLAATTVGASDFFTIGQNIEGYNVADLDWGSASAKTITLSFWVRSSLTGTFGGALRNQASNRSYPFSYTINSANTWEYETITIPGDTTGTWDKTSGNGCYVFFSLGTGSNFSGTAGAWVGGTGLTSTTGATNVVSTNGATFYLTGIQFEVGSAATAFDYVPYQTQIQLCKRYFEKSFAQETAPAHNTGGLPVIPVGSSLGCGGNAYWTIPFQVAKRISTYTVRWYDPLAPHPASENWVRYITACNSGADAGPNTNMSFNSLTSNNMSGYSQLGTGVPPIFYWTVDAEIG